jgi:hypothetical protein
VLRLTDATLACLTVKEALWNTRASLCAIPLAPGDEPKRALLAENFVSLVHQAVHLGARVDWNHHKASRKKAAEDAVIAPRRKGGQESGKARRDKAARGWKQHAAALAEEMRKNYPGFSQDRVADEIIFGWKEKDVPAPGHRTLKAYISKLEHGRSQPKRHQKIRQ